MRGDLRSRPACGVHTCEWMSGLVWKSCVIWKRRGWQGTILLSQVARRVRLRVYSLICTVGKMGEKRGDGIKRGSERLFAAHLRLLMTFGVLSDTHIWHGDFLQAWSWVIGSISKVTIRVFCTHVLSQMIVHLLSLFPGCKMHTFLAPSQCHRTSGFRATRADYSHRRRD